MTDKSNRRDPYSVGPMGAVATVPAEFLSSAIFEVVQGAYHLGAAVGRAANKLRHR